jgi:hypothetical protein
MLDMTGDVDLSWCDWNLPVNWRAQKRDKEDARLGPSMGIRFPLQASMEDPAGITRSLISGFKEGKGMAINLVAIATRLYRFRASLEQIKFLPKNLIVCIARWYSEFTGIQVCGDPKHASSMFEDASSMFVPASSMYLTVLIGAGCPK